MSTLFKTAEGKWFVKMSKTEARQVLADGGWKKTAMPVLVPTWTQMDEPAQYRFNISASEDQVPTGTTIAITFDPSKNKADYTNPSDVKLNQKEKSMLGRAMEQAINEAALFPECSGLKWDADQQGDLEYDLWISSKAFEGGEGTDDEEMLDNGKFKPTPQELKAHKEFALHIKNSLISNGFRFDGSLQM